MAKTHVLIVYIFHLVNNIKTILLGRYAHLNDGIGADWRIRYHTYYNTNEVTTVQNSAGGNYLSLMRDKFAYEMNSLD